MANDCSDCCTDLQCEVDALKTNVTELFERTDDINNYLGVSESPFIVVDNEAELDAALLVGKHILIRGEGSNGEVSLTNTKTLNIPGTRIWGYGYTENNIDHYSKIKFDHLFIPAYGAGNLTGFNVEAPDIQVAGLEIQGNDAISLADGSYFVFALSTSIDVARFKLSDVYVTNVNRIVSKTGAEGSAVTSDLTIERVRANRLIGYAVALQQGLYRPRIKDCHFDIKPSGFGLLFPNTKGIYFASDVKDAYLSGNTIENCSNEGIELTSTATIADPAIFHPMSRNHIIGNTVKNVGAIGISQGFCIDGIVNSNAIDGAVGIGIESTGGQSSSDHNSVIFGNNIRNISSVGGYCSGISCDRSTGDNIFGNTIDTVYSSFNGAGKETYARGILVYDSKNTFVHGNNISDVDGTGCFVMSAILNNMDIQAVIQNNVFKAAASNTKAVYAVYVFDSRAVVRNNISWAPVGGAILQSFYVNNNAPATVYPGFEWTAEVSSQTFMESNLELTY
jgi:Right handed beta helix region